MSIDFLPADYVNVPSRRRTAMWRRLALLLLAGLVTWGSVHELQQRSQIESKSQAAHLRLRGLESRLPDAGSLRQRLKTSEQNASFQAALDLAIRPSQILSIVTEALPRGTRLTDFQTERVSEAASESALAASDADRHRTAGAAIGGPLRVELHGTAESDELVFRFLKRLEERGLLAQVELKRVERIVSAGGSMRRFDVRGLVHPPASIFTQRLPELPPPLSQANVEARSP